jgi:competence protein ComEC
MEHFIKQSPFFRLFLFTTFGILAAQWFTTSTLPWVLASSLLLVLVIILYYFNKSLTIDTLWGGTFNSLCVAVGFILAQSSKPLADVPIFQGNTNFSVLIEKNEGVINHQARYTARLFSSDTLKFTHKTVKVRIMLDTTDETFREGEIVFCQGMLRKIENRGNPGEFDYQTWANRRQIYYSANIPKGACTPMGYHEPFILRQWVSKIRIWLDQSFVNQGIAGDQLAVLVALTTGDKATLDPELRSAFSTAGLMHVLAVSGLHIGIIYLILGWLVKPLTFYRYGKPLKIILVISFLWLYAFFTGMAPSVTRAVLMFSFLVIGEASGRKYASENALFASAFFLMLFNPNIIYEVGFQLSYLAVFGIFQFYKPIYDLFYFEQKIPDKIWSLLALSLAAQLATTPISLYYFNQFPTYFLLSNLLIVPLVGFIIQGTILFLVLGFFEPAANIVAWVVNHMLKGMTFYSEWVSQLPVSRISGIYIDMIVLWGLYALIPLVFGSFKTRSPRQLQLTSVSLLLLLGYGLVTSHLQTQKREIHVFKAMHNPVFVVEANRIHSLQSDTSVSVHRYVSQLSSFYKTHLEPASHVVVSEPVSVWTQQQQKILLAPRTRLEKMDTAVVQHMDVVVGRNGFVDNRSLRHLK